MHKVHTLLFALVFALCVSGLCTAEETPQTTLKETEEFVAKTPEVKAWAEKTAQHLRQEVTKLAKGVEGITDENAFRLPNEIKENKKIDAKEWQARKRQAVMDIAAYAQNTDRHLLAILAAAGLKDSEIMQKRILNTPAISFFLFEKHGGQNAATTSIDKSQMKDGFLTVQALKTGFGTLAFRPKTTAHTIDHELVHLLLQGWDNELNDEQLPLPESIGDKPMWKYKPFKRVRGGDLLAEGFAELTTQRALALIGDLPVGTTYINQVGSTAIMCDIDQTALNEWFTGKLTNKEFSERFQAKLKQKLLTNKNITDAMAERGAAILTNYALDGSNPTQGVMGRVTDPALTLNSFMGTLRSNGVDDLSILRAQLPLHVQPKFPVLGVKEMPK